jgi:hypothetical protein
MYDIVYDIVYEILQYIGQIGIQRLRKVASMYRTIEIGTFSGPTRAWAIWYETKPFACPPRMQLRSCTPWMQSAGSPQDVRPPLTPATRPPPCVGRNVRTIHWWTILKLQDKAAQRIQWPSLSRCAATMPKIIVIMRIRRSIVTVRVVIILRGHILRQCTCHNVGSATIFQFVIIFLSWNGNDYDILMI